MTRSVERTTLKTVLTNSLRVVLNELEALLDAALQLRNGCLEELLFKGIELADALAGERPEPQPASPAAAQRWREIEVDHEAGVIRRPAGLRIDNGGSGKGYAADLAAASAPSGFTL